ncbi:MAG TPA: hypothetical protein VE824_05440 [Gaiellales bacterium]|nr:hypothetical protein [Gaiellales bacterium]
MTDDDQRYEELRRRLATEGQASAPPDLAPEVMRRVRAEPRSRERRYLRPAATLVAAAAVVGAALLGISHLGNGSTGSGAPNGAGAGGFSQAPRASSTQKDMSSNGAAAQGSLIVRHVKAERLGSIFAPARVPACPPGARLSATVPSAQLDEVDSRLRSAAAGAAAGPGTRDVELHRAPKGQARIRITCP